MNLQLHCIQTWMAYPKGRVHIILCEGFLYLAFNHRAELHCAAFVSSQSDLSELMLLPASSSHSQCSINFEHCSCCPVTLSHSDAPWKKSLICYLELNTMYDEFNRWYEWLTLALTSDHTMVVVSSLWISLEKQSACERAKGTNLILFIVQRVNLSARSRGCSPAARIRQKCTLLWPGRRPSGHLLPREQSPRS